MSKNKYKNRKTIYDGITFDSLAEMRYYKLHKNEKGLALQQKFVLQKPFRKYGKTHREVAYIPDFVFFIEGKPVKAVDVKGMRTAVFNIKAKWFMAQYEIPLYIAEYDYRTGLFIEKIA